eukprot:GGOE01023703.1.p1 GENE.GGOE01023703.1~~GGOE01023703.1.p1  ORF type:complete len:458 (-),score=116.06 GGOE01023703.1:711-2084(-)
MGCAAITGLDPSPWFLREDHVVGLVVLIHSATGIPKMDVIGYSDTVATLWLERDGQRVGRAVRTQVCWNHETPVWKAYREFDVPVDAHDVLHVKLHDHDVGRQELIGAGRIAVGDLNRDGPTVVDIIVEGRSERKCKLMLERISCPSRLIKHVCIIRHAQSEWNAAQEAGAYHRMIRCDHPIDHIGREQAQEFRQRWVLLEEPDPDDPYVDSFMNAEVVFCSPFTRAIQTCLLALEGHPTLRQKGITLLSSAREIKKLGGFDSVGKASGDRIVARVKEQMCSIMPSQDVGRLIPRIDLYNTVSEWWTPLNSTDTTRSLNERFEDFMCTLKYREEKSMIVVGHSLFFLDLLNRYLSPEFRKKNPELSHDLRTRKLANVACMGLTIDFSQTYPQVVDAELMFGTALCGHKVRTSWFSKAVVSSPTLNDLKYSPSTAMEEIPAECPPPPSLPGQCTAEGS